MKYLLLVLTVILAVYVFNLLTSGSRYVYNGTSIDIAKNGIPAFSYQDATTVAEHIK